MLTWNVPLVAIFQTSLLLPYKSLQGCNSFEGYLRESCSFARPVTNIFFIHLQTALNCRAQYVRTETERLSIWQIWHHSYVGHRWFHMKLAFWQPPLQPVMIIPLKWWISFSVQIGLSPLRGFCFSSCVLIDDIISGEYVACLSMELSKAFDCLPHCLTICKLYSYGVSREACTLIASYLRGRKQRIKLGNSRSEWAELLKGVPQGSLLGPLVFNIFLNDIFNFVSNSDLYNYADDNCISVSHKDISVLSAQMENEAQVMAKWFADNSIKANADKFQGIIVPGGRENKDVQISLGGVDIAFVQK